MKIALLGYGKMGQEIERLAEKKGHEIILIIDSEKDWAEEGSRLKEAEVAIEFSMPQHAVDNIFHCFNANVPVVVGTTGWLEHFDRIRQICIEQDHTLFYASNYSIGVNLFFNLNRYLARLMTDYQEYEISIEETHHIHKLDAPSGTAIAIANDIIQNIGRKEKWVKETSERPDELGITSYRTENVPGTHVVKYDSEIDSIQIIHTAKNRRGFATGAILAAEFIRGKKGFFDMKDLLHL